MAYPMEAKYRSFTKPKNWNLLLFESHQKVGASELHQSSFSFLDQTPATSAKSLTTLAYSNWKCHWPFSFDIWAKILYNLKQELPRWMKLILQWGFQWLVVFSIWIQKNNYIWSSSLWGKPFWTLYSLTYSFLGGDNGKHALPSKSALLCLFASISLFFSC